MSNKQIEDLVDLMFDTDMEEVMKEKSTLEYIHKLQQENKELNRMCEIYSQSLYNADLTKMKNILTELEEWLKDYIPMLETGDMIEEATQDTLKEVLDKIQELKEKYK